MTFPGVDPDEDITRHWQPGRKLFRSWLLLAGLLPVEYDDVSMAEVEPGRRFLEESKLLSARRWRHERVLEPVPGGTRLSDRVGFEPRLVLLGGAQEALFRLVFRLRHRNLRRDFGTTAASS